MAGSPIALIVVYRLLRLIVAFLCPDMACLVTAICDEILYIGIYMLYLSNNYVCARTKAYIYDAIICLVRHKLFDDAMIRM